MNKIISFFKKFITVSLVLFLSVIIYDSIFNIEYTSNFIKIVKSPLFLVLFFSYLLFYLFRLIFKIIDDGNHPKIIKWSFIIIALIAELLIFVFYRVSPITDSMKLMDYAKGYLDGFSNSNIDMVSYYLKIYNNNNFYLALIILAMKISSIIKIMSFKTVLYIFNIISLNISYFFIYKFAKEIKDEKFATKVLILNIFNPLNYLFLWWTYTCTFSLCLITGFIYFSLKLKHNKNNILYDIVLGLILTICYLLRPIIVIPLIAFLIILFFKYYENKNVKKVFLEVLILFISAAVVFVPLNKLSNSLSPEKNTAYPTTFWIMMGLEGNGSYNEEDNTYVRKFETTTEKKEAINEGLKERLNNYKLSGLVNHLLVKMPVTWSSGISSYPVRLENTTYPSSISRWISGEKRDLVSIYCQSYRTIILVMIMIYLIRLSKKGTEIKNDIFYFILMFFGAIAFYLIWEAKDAYSYPFLPILSLLACLEMTNSCYKKYKINYKYMMIVTIILSIALFKPICLDKDDYKKYSLYISPSQSNYKINKEFKSVEQELFINKKFNRIELKATNENETDYKYKLLLTYPNNCQEKYTINSKMIKDDYITLKRSKTCDFSKGKYKINIENKKGKDISFYQMYIDTLDTYDGGLKINNKNITSDLFVRFYDGYKTSYMSKKMYISIVILTLVLEWLLFYRKGEKNEKE